MGRASTNDGIFISVDDREILKVHRKRYTNGILMELHEILVNTLQ